MTLVKSFARAAYLSSLGHMPPSWALRIQFLRHLGTWPDLRRPRTFNERLQVRKLRVPDVELYARLSDKVAVKAFVAARVGEEYIIPTLWSGSSLPPRERRSWDPPFVCKANHGSGLNYFVRTPEELDWTRLEAVVATWSESRWQPYLHEKWYDRIPRQLLVEPLLADAPHDYKFFVFGGRVEFVQVDSRRFTDHRRTFFDAAWVPQPFTLRFAPESVPIPRPAHLGKMIEIAECLGADFDFVRVDLYDLPQGPLFGEMTFTPGAGFDPFCPPSYDLTFGDLWAAAEANPATSREVSEGVHPPVRRRG